MSTIFSASTAARPGFVAVLLGAFLLAGCAVSPEPFTEEENLARAAADLERLFADQAKVERPITLEEATARALKYNLDYRLKLMEKAVALGEADLSSYDLLPKVTAQAGYSARTNEDGTDATPGQRSITTEKTHNTADLELTWNVLDFGIGYLRAGQKADLALIVEERRRQVVHNIVKDVRAAFWRTVAAEQVLPGLDALRVRVREALDASEKLLDEGLGDAADHLAYQRDLLDTLARLESTRRDLENARANLATLMNLHPATPFTLAVDEADRAAVLDFPLEMDSAETLALVNRTELRGEAYQSRIYAEESKIAVLRMLPGLSFDAGLHFDDDHFLINNSWGTMGVSLAWNLMNVVRLPAALELAESQVNLSQMRRLALSMAVISQVHVSGLRYGSALREYALARKRSRVEARLRDFAGAARSASQGGELAEIQGEVRSLQARLREAMAFAFVQETYGGLFASLGLDPLPAGLPDQSLETVSQALEDTFARWDAGRIDLPALPEPAAAGS